MAAAVGSWARARALVPAPRRREVAVLDDRDEELVLVLELLAQHRGGEVAVELLVGDGDASLPLDEGLDLRRRHALLDGDGDGRAAAAAGRVDLAKTSARARRQQAAALVALGAHVPAGRLLDLPPLRRHRREPGARARRRCALRACCEALPLPLPHLPIAS